MADTYQAVEVSAPGVLRVVERPIREPSVAAGARAWVDHSAVECARGAGLARPSTPGPGRANVPGYDHGGHKLGLPAREDAARLANRSCLTYAPDTLITTEETAMSIGIDMKFEIVVIPVSDIDRAKKFYANLGWRLDAEFGDGKGFRILQFTPPGSACSVIFGKNVTAAAPGSAQGLYLIVSDLEAARDDLRSRSVEISEAFHGAGDVYAGTDEPYLFGRLRVSGPDPDHGSYRSFASFKDPDGNGWLFQEVTARLPGRVDADDTTFTSSTELATALRRAAAAHGEHEKRTGQH